MGFFKNIFSSKTQSMNTVEVKESVAQKNGELSNEELAAIFTACIMSYMNNGCKLVVKSFKRVETKSPVWNLAGVIDLTRS